SRVTVSGEVVFYSKEQGEFTLPKSERSHRIVRYIDGLAYVLRQHRSSVFVFKDSKLELVPGKIWRGDVITDEDIPEAKLDNPHFWSHEISYDETEPRKATKIEFSNGDQKMEFTATRTWIHYSPTGFYIIDKEGVCFISVKTRKKKVVLKRSGKGLIEIEPNNHYWRNLCFYFDDGRIGSLNTETDKMIEISATESSIVPMLLMSNDTLIYIDNKNDWYYRSGQSNVKLFDLGVKK
ncbi:MAG: hypothetical protein P1V97_23320, partial [Planctomycetota bacterium]|nr:hypothetical protein [Planctomycetota bacterium]